jgi:hypothetical protein
MCPIAFAGARTQAQVKLLVSPNTVNAHHPVNVTIVNNSSQDIRFCGILDASYDNVGYPFFLQRRAFLRWKPMPAADVVTQSSNVKLPHGEALGIVERPYSRGTFRYGLSYSLGDSCSQAPLQKAYSRSLKVR